MIERAARPDACAFCGAPLEPLSPTTNPFTVAAPSPPELNEPELNEPELSEPELSEPEPWAQTAAPKSFSFSVAFQLLILLGAVSVAVQRRGEIASFVTAVARESGLTPAPAAAPPPADKPPVAAAAAAEASSAMRTRRRRSASMRRAHMRRQRRAASMESTMNAARADDAKPPRSAPSASPMDGLVGDKFE